MKKTVKIIGVIVAIVISLLSIFMFCLNITMVKENDYPATSILPAIMFVVLFLAGIFTLIGIFKSNKKILIISLVMYAVVVLFDPISRIVNTVIIENAENSSTVQEKEEIDVNDKTSYEKQCKLYLISEIYSDDETQRPEDLEKISVIAYVDNVKITTVDKMHLYTIICTEGDKSIEVQYCSKNDNEIIEGAVYKFSGTFFTENNVMMANFATLKDNDSANKKSDDDLPSDAAMVTYAEEIIRDHYGDAKFRWADYYNIVKPEYDKRAKIEGTVSIHSVDYEFIVIFEFDDDFDEYTPLMLEIDEKTIYDYR